MPIVIVQAISVHFPNKDIFNIMLFYSSIILENAEASVIGALTP